MASMKYTKMWILLSEYNFQVDSQKCRDLLCCICKSLLKNAQQSICGCAFCFDCIKNYLATDAKYCPGRSNGCKELMCNIERNMQIDHAANKKVANVIVKCPIEFCDFRTELKCMDEHIESHIDDNSNHGKFLREPLEKLKKEMTSLREDLQMYKKDSMSKELMIMKIRDEIDCLRKTNEKELMDLREELISSSSFAVKGNAKEFQEDDDIDWQLEIFTDESEADFSATKKRRVQEAAVPRVAKEIRDFIAMEVRRNTESLRTAQNRLQEEIRSLRQELQNAERKRFARNDLLQIDDKKGTKAGEELERKEKEDRPSDNLGPSKTSSPPRDTQESAAVVAVVKSAADGGKTTRRKLRRELPQVRIDLTSDVQDQTSSAAKSGSGSGAPALRSSSASKTAASRKPSKVSISTKPLHPLTLLRLDQKERRAKALANSRPRTFNHIAARLDHKKGVGRNLVGNSNLTTLTEPFQWMRNISPFEFRIENFAEKHLQSKQGFNSNVFSQPFFSAKNGYKMCLRIDFDPNGDGFSSHLGAFFSVLRGECDDHLPWPMKLEVTISIIDQVTFLPYTSRTFDYATAPEHWKYVFHRPSIMAKQCWFGTPQFVHFDFIFNNAPLRLNDSILIRCSVGS